MHDIEERVVSALERQATASESLLAIAEKEAIEFVNEEQPPVCPHCGKVDPEVTMLLEARASGKLSEFVAQVECHSCNRASYIVVGRVNMFSNIRLAQDSQVNGGAG